MAQFTYELGQNWKLQQIIVEEKGSVIETMYFYNNHNTIRLDNESCEKLRAVFKKITK